jgi:hypothetical protein
MGFESKPPAGVDANHTQASNSASQASASLHRKVGRIRRPLAFDSELVSNLERCRDEFGFVGVLKVEPLKAT